MNTQGQRGCASLGGCDSRSYCGFTLIELLVVAALVVVLSVVVLRVTARDEIADIRSAEATVAGMFTKARTTALLKRRPARLIVCIDGSRADAYLGKLAVVARNASGTGWEPVSEPYQLPASVRIVPDGSIPVAAGVVWRPEVHSTFGGTDAAPVTGWDCSNYGYLEFGATGGTLNGRTLILSPVRRTAGGFEFFLPEQVRVFLLRGSGHYVLLRDANAL